MRKPKQISSGKLQLAAINDSLVVPVVCVTGTTKSESVTSHILEKHGIDTITVSVNLEHQAKVLTRRGHKCEVPELEEKLAAALYNGFTVVGPSYKKHYGFFQKSAGNGRNAELVFASVKRSESETWPQAIWRQFFDLTREIMGVEGRTFEDVLGDVFLYSKALARMAAPGSSGVPIEHPLAIQYLKRYSVIFTKDLSGTNETPYKNPLSWENGEYTIKGTLRETKPTDGMVLYGPGPRLSFGLEAGKISVQEHERGQSLLHAFRRTGRRKFWRKLEPLLLKCPSLVQPRSRGSLKGAAHYANLDLYIKGRYENGEYRYGAPDVIVFDSAKKYADDEDNFRLDKWFICHVSSNDKGWVNMSAPVVSAIGANADVDIMKPIVDYWCQNLEDMASSDHVTKAKGVADFLSATAPKRLDQELEERELMVKALRTNALLVYDNHFTKKVVDKATSFVHRLISGKVPMPGAYPFISVDPNAIMKGLVEKGVLVPRDGVKIPTLGNGEYYYNGNDCRGIIARSPLTHPDQVKIVKLVKNDDYKLYNNLFIMNAYDGIWIDLSGADMDGDEVMLVLEKECGRFKKKWVTNIIEAIKSNDFGPVCYEEGKSGTPLPWSVNTLIQYLVKTSTPSNVGVLSNSNVTLIELKTHILNLIKAAEILGCNSIRMEPKFEYDSTLDAFKVEGNTLVTKGPLVKRERNKYGGLVPVTATTWSLVQAYEHAQRAGKLYDSGSVIINREVDRDKTDIGASKEEIESIETNLVTYSSIARRYYKGEYTPGTAYFERKNPGDNKKYADKKDADKVAKKSAAEAAMADNAFSAYTPLGYMTAYVSKWWSNHQAMFKKWSRNLGAYCFSLLNEVEKVQSLEIQDKVHAMRVDYGTLVSTIEAATNGDAALKSVMLDELREDTKQQLKNFANANFIEYRVIAATAYCDCHVSAYESDSTFAWLLADELLEVFERGDEQWVFQPFPKTMENNPEWVADVRDGYVGHYDLLRPDVFKPVDTAFKYYNQYIQETFNTKGRYGAFMKAIPEQVGDITSCTAPTSDKYTINIGVLGDDKPALLVKYIRDNDNVFDVTVTPEGTTVVAINGHVIGVVYLTNYSSVNLLNKRLIWDEDSLVSVKHKDGATSQESWDIKGRTVVRMVVCEL